MAFEVGYWKSGKVHGGKKPKQKGAHTETGEKDLSPKENRSAKRPRWAMGNRRAEINTNQPRVELPGNK